MIGDEHERTHRVRSLEVFEAVNVHQIVGCHLNPARAYLTLAPGPEFLPQPLIHLVRLIESKALDARKDGDLFRGWVNCPSVVSCQLSVVQSWLSVRLLPATCQLR